MRSSTRITAEAREISDRSVPYRYGVMATDADRPQGTETGWPVAAPMCQWARLSGRNRWPGKRRLKQRHVTPTGLLRGCRRSGRQIFAYD